MNVLVVSWEHPPVVVGGLGRHVHALGRALAGAGHDVVVLTRHPAGPHGGAPTLDVEPPVPDGSAPPGGDSGAPGCVRVLRVPEDPLHLEFGRDLVAWTLAWQHAAIRAALPLLRGWTPDVVHAHDWLAAHAGIALADAAGAPLVATVHATEAGRNAGLSTTLHRQVHAVERWLARRADALITCSAAMRREVEELFGAPSAAVVPNGIAAREWAVDPERVAAARARWTPDGGPLLVHFGRLEYEKGVQDLLAALPRIARDHPAVRLLVVGTGTHRDALVEAARDQGDRVTFAGYLPDADLAAAVTAAAAVVLPSHYEPFGIVALEAAAAGAPLVVARSGGLAEVVVDGETGTSFAPRDVAGLADAVGRVLDDPQGAAARARRAHARLAAFAWPTIAERTAEVYAAAVRRAPVRPADPRVGGP